MMPKLTNDIIRNEVARHWNLFASKSGAAEEESYAHECSVFGFRSQRPEPARLSVKRREREFYTSSSVLKVQVGPVDVVVLSETSAVASYTFEFHAQKVARGGSLTEDHYECGRATQVFAYDQDGQLRIFHEHLSIPVGTIAPAAS